MNWVGGTVYPGVKAWYLVPEDKISRGGHSTRGKVSPGTRYHVVFSPQGTRYGGDKINRYTGPGSLEVKASTFGAGGLGSN